MADITLSYKGSTIATMSASGSKTIQTKEKYCEDDITLLYIEGSKFTVSTFTENAMKILFSAFQIGSGNIQTAWSGSSQIGCSMCLMKIPAAVSSVKYKLSTSTAYNATNYKMAIGVMEAIPNALFLSDSTDFLAKNTHDTTQLPQTEFTLDLSTVTTDSYLCITASGWNSVWADITME